MYNKKFFIPLIGIIVLIAAFGFWSMKDKIVPEQSSALEELEGNGSPSAPAVNNGVTENKPNAETPTTNGSTTPTTEQPKDKMENFKHLITVKTNLGDIQFETYDADAPKTVQNFIDLANKGFYNGVVFHRVIDGFMIQGGDPTGTGMGGPGYQFEDELNSSSESYKVGYVKGAVAMANSGPDTNGSQFFIMVADYPLPHAYTIFGRVTMGQEVANAIAKVQKDRNDKPLSPVTMESVMVSTIN